MDIMETLLILRDKCENPKNVNGNYGNWFGKLPADGSSRRGKSISEEHRHKLSESHKGKIPWNKGMKMKPMSDEQKQKISNTLKGKTVSEETRKKLSIAAKNRPYKKLSDNHKQKISISSKNWWNNSSEEERNRRNEKISSKLKGIKRKPHTEEWKRNMSEKLKGRKMSDEFRKKMSEVARERETKKRLSKEK